MEEVLLCIIVQVVVSWFAIGSCFLPKLWRTGNLGFQLQPPTLEDCRERDPATLSKYVEETIIPTQNYLTLLEKTKKKLKEQKEIALAFAGPTELICVFGIGFAIRGNYNMKHLLPYGLGSFLPFVISFAIVAILVLLEIVLYRFDYEPPKNCMAAKEFEAYVREAYCGDEELYDEFLRKSIVVSHGNYLEKVYESVCKKERQTKVCMWSFLYLPIIFAIISICLN